MADARTKRIDLAARLYGAAKALTTTKHISLGDLTYNVRDAEGQGWTGPAVRQWSNGVAALNSALAEYEAATIAADTRISVVDVKDPGPNDIETTWGEFVGANPEAPEEIGQRLSEDGVAVLGGGASAAFRITIIDTAKPEGGSNG